MLKYLLKKLSHKIYILGKFEEDNKVRQLEKKRHLFTIAPNSYLDSFAVIENGTGFPDRVNREKLWVIASRLNTKLKKIGSEYELGAQRDIGYSFSPRPFED